MNKTFKPVAAVFATSCVLTAIACGSSEGNGGTEDPFNSSSGTSGTSGETSSSASSGFASSGTSGATSSGDPKECAAQEAAATLAKKPVDIVFVIDNSGSMSGEIAEVEKQINDNFSTIIDAAKIDYKVIMVAQYGSNANQDVCIKAPLAAGVASCSPPAAQPTDSAKFVHHAVQVESRDAWCRLNEFWNKADRFGKHPTGWGGLLRANSFKVFAVITDDRVGCSFGGKSYDDQGNAAAGDTAAKQFDADLLALSPTNFGTAAKRNYVWHSIIALAPFNNADLTLAHPPSAPIVTATCTPGAAAIGTGYQGLSKLTGGLRYPTCGLNYTTIFKEMAKSVVSGATVSCEFPVPAAPAGETLDLSTVVPRYTPGAGGASVDFQQVANAAACAPDKFYIENNTVKLCPATCDKVQTDSTAAIKVLFGCKPKGAN